MFFQPFDSFELLSALVADIPCIGSSVAARLVSTSRFLDNFELLVSRVDFSSRLVSRNSSQNGCFMA